jgi:hypothetical protein
LPQAIPEEVGSQNAVASGGHARKRLNNHKTLIRE